MVDEHGHYINTDAGLISDFLSFKVAGINEGFDEKKKKMVVKSVLLL